MPAIATSLWRSHFCVDKYVSCLYCVQLPFFLFGMETIVTSAQLASNVERGGSHLACPGQVVVLTCNETGTAELTWISDGFSPDIVYTVFEPEGTSKVRMGFTANLTEAFMEGSVLKMTSTLTFTATVSLVLDGLTVECRRVVNFIQMYRMATVEITGTREHYCMCRASILTHLCTYFYSPTISPPVPTAQCVRVWGGWSHCYCRVDVP